MGNRELAVSLSRRGRRKKRTLYSNIEQQFIIVNFSESGNLETLSKTYDRQSQSYRYSFCYYEKGLMYQEGDYFGSRLDGKVTTYDDNGKLKCRFWLVSGYNDGIYTK